MLDFLSTLDFQRHYHREELFGKINTRVETEFLCTPIAPSAVYKEQYFTFLQAPYHCSPFHLDVNDTLESIFCIFSSFLKMLHFTVLILSTWNKTRKTTFSRELPPEKHEKYLGKCGAVPLGQTHHLPLIRPHIFPPPYARQEINYLWPLNRVSSKYKTYRQEKPKRWIYKLKRRSNASQGAKSLLWEKDFTTPQRPKAPRG